MSNVDANDQHLQLAHALTRYTERRCRGLTEGNANAEIFQLVTPVTARLLHWWFGKAVCRGRPFNFHAGQRQAILNIIVAHEVLQTTTLRSLYERIAPAALLDSARLTEVSKATHTHPEYCVKMAAGTGRTWVLLALLIWQLLNKNAALAAGRDDPRFTRRFLVVASGPIARNHLLDAFLGRLKNGSRDFAGSDIASFASLFIPEAQREGVFDFVRTHVRLGEEIGRNTAGAMIAIADRRLLAEDGNEYPVASAGRFDRRYGYGNAHEFLAGLPELMVFNHALHRAREIRADGESTAMTWQKNLMRIAGSKGRCFTQIDFSATPYDATCFPHIVADFDVKSAMHAGLMKSLVLDRRKEIAALPLEFKTACDAEGKPMLSRGQGAMLRAGLQQLCKLEASFARIDPARHPKMLVVCEDAAALPLAIAFLRGDELRDEELRDEELRGEGLSDDEVMAIGCSESDRYSQPRIIVGTLTLCEGFTIDNICVIVPLRAAWMPIQPERAIGCGLGPMWRDPEYADIKRENRERIHHGQAPNNPIDILFVVEHPAFEMFYDDLTMAGLVGIVTKSDDDS